MFWQTKKVLLEYSFTKLSIRKSSLSVLFKHGLDCFDTLLGKQCAELLLVEGDEQICINIDPPIIQLSLIFIIVAP